MLKSIILVWLALAAGIAVAALVIPSVEFDGGLLTLLWVALLFGLVNAVIGPLLHLISLPLTVLTLGLFGLVVNGVLLAITAGLTDSLDVGGVFATIVAAIVISVISTLVLMAAGRVFTPELQH